MPRADGRRNGFTLFELMIALSLLGLVVGNVYMILADSSKAMNTQSMSIDTETQARRALDRIALAVLGASRESLWTTKEAPLYSSELNLVSNLGVQDGEPVWSGPQRISLVEPESAENQITWAENPNEPSEKKVVWAKGIGRFAEGEIPGNGIDDNGNGLQDEKGLSFNIDGNSVRIELTIEKVARDGQRFTKRLTTLVTCRN